MQQGNVKFWLKLLILPPILVGGYLIFAAVSGKQAPVRNTLVESVYSVAVVTVPRVAVVPRAIAYGAVQPATTWNAVAEVEGRVIDVHENLKNGALIQAGQTLVRIDPADYALRVAQFEAQIDELKLTERNTQASLAIEERSLALAKNDLERKRALISRGNASKSAVDSAEIAVLGREQSAQNLRNTLRLLPAKRALLDAQLADAKLDLDRTVIRAPMDLRIANATVEKRQYASRGQTLFTGDGIAVAEVTAQIPLDRLMNMVPTPTNFRFDAAVRDGQIQSIFKFDVTVRLRAGSQVIEWPARLVGTADTLDEKTRTIGLVVAVDEPYAQAQPGRRPPLTKNMFVEVDLRGVPRAAIHNGRVFVVDTEDRLRRQAVDVAFAQGDFAVLASGLREGDRVVAGDLVPAIDGMKLNPIIDSAAQAALIAEATNAGDAR